MEAGNSNITQKNIHKFDMKLNLPNRIICISNLSLVQGKSSIQREQRGSLPLRFHQSTYLYIQVCTKELAIFNVQNDQEIYIF